MGDTTFSPIVLHIRSTIAILAEIFSIYEQHTIPDSVTEIGCGAFCDCDELAISDIPDSVVLGKHVFSYFDVDLYDYIDR